jgi:hypothetical protein
MTFEATITYRMGEASRSITTRAEIPDSASAEQIAATVRAVVMEATRSLGDEKP